MPPVSMVSWSTAGHPDDDCACGHAGRPAGGPSCESDVTVMMQWAAGNCLGVVTVRRRTRPHGSCGKVPKGGFRLVGAGHAVGVTDCSLWIGALQLGNQCAVHLAMKAYSDDVTLDIARRGRGTRHAAGRPARVVQRAR